MHHDTPLITTIVAGLVLAYIFGMLANRLKLPPLVGYLFAGVLVGPHTPGFVADQALGAELAELGVVLLMFGVGLHFSLKDLMSVRALAIPGAIAQIAVATALGAGLGVLLGWDVWGALLFGLALSVASTVVLLKALQDRRLIESERGRIAVGWLIVEDLAMVLALVLIPAFAGLNGADTGVHDPFVSFVERIFNMPVGVWGVLAITIVKIAAFVGFMLVVGRRVIPWALHLTAHTGSRELFRLAVLAIALGVALGSAVLFGVSLALGAFFAGMILSESELSHRAANETLPLRDAFAVLFFVSVGMLFDPTIILSNPLPVLATVFIIVIGKSLAAFGIVMLFGRPASTALTISASLAQIGEFSFILASMGVSLAIMPQEGQDLILAGALISIILNPIVFALIEVIRPRIEAQFGPRVAAAPEARVEPGTLAAASTGPATTDMPREAAIERGAPGPDDDRTEPLTVAGHTVLVGYGQVGRIVADGLKAAQRDVVVIEDSDHDVAAARAAGLEVIYGNAASPQTLKLANLGAARNLLVAISNAFEAGTVCESGRKLNPGISIIARAYSEEEESFLRGLGASVVIRGEREIGKGILALLREEDVGTAVPVNAPVAPLPPTENILAQAAATLAVVTPAVAPASVAGQPVEEAPALIPVIEVIRVPAAAEVPPAPPAEPAALPPAELVAIAAEAPTPSIGEAPPAIDEVVVPPSQPAVAPVEPGDEPRGEASEVSALPSVNETPPPEPEVIIEPPPAGGAGEVEKGVEPAEGSATPVTEGVIVLPPPETPAETDTPPAEPGPEAVDLPSDVEPPADVEAEDESAEMAPEIPVVKPEPRE
ncbi:sodium:proton antiporter [Nostoc sp. 3335mG]|nr:sodium:proton antiporter [Nostoc sp. 3335mG]